MAGTKGFVFPLVEALVVAVVSVACSTGGGGSPTSVKGFATLTPEQTTPTALVVSPTEVAPTIVETIVSTPVPLATSVVSSRVATIANTPPASIDSPSPTVAPVATSGSSQGTADPSCAIASFTSGLTTFHGTALPLLGTRVNPDGSTDILRGTGAGAPCLTCQPPPGAPGKGMYKILATWIPGGQYIVFVAESNSHPKLAKSAQRINPEIQNGYWGNLWAMTADGSKWWQLTQYSTQTDGTSFGVLAPIASSKKVVWAKFLSGPTGAAVMGSWKLMEADLDVSSGAPKLTNARDISSRSTTIFEPQEFSPDGSAFLVSQDTNMASPYGWDTYRYDAVTGASVNLNNTPDQWDEHARYSPDGKIVVWASSSPYPPTVGPIRYAEYASQDLELDFWIMNADGSGKKQLTFYNTPGHAESAGRKVIANVPNWSADGTQVLSGALPGGPAVVSFAGACGKQ